MWIGLNETSRAVQKWYLKGLSGPPGGVETDRTVHFCDMRGYYSTYVAGQLRGRKGADFYLLDQIHAKLGFPATLEAIRRLNARAVLNATLVEDKANGSAVIATLRREVPGMIPIDPQGGIRLSG
jgi:phage terminase large subunit-like protein